MPRSVPADTQPTEPTNSLVAAAITVSSAIDRRKYRKPESWQDEAWGFYDTQGELRYAVTWFSNALSRATIHAATLSPDGTVTPVTTGPSSDAMRELLGGTKGQALLKAMAQHFFVAGEWYLVGREAREEDEDTISTAKELWEIISVQEMHSQGTGPRQKWWIDYGDGEKIPLTSKDVIIRMWNPHPRRHTQPDSPVRSALPVLRELDTLSRHINAQVYSRLAGAGLLLVPSEMTFAKPPNSSTPSAAVEGDPFLVALGTTMMQAISDPGSPEAFVPTMLKAPGESLQHVKHLTFWSPLDEKALEMRDNALRRLALALDMPPEVLLGTADVNHWGSWQIDESSIKSHLEPALEVICGSLAVSYLHKAGDADDIVAYDTSSLRMRPNRSKEALELYDRGAINDDALRRETGFEKDDEQDEESRKVWLLRKVAAGSASPEMVLAALKQLGVDLGVAVESDRMREARPDPSLQDHPVREEPEREAAGLLSTCDALAHRAMERAGNRLKNRTNARGLDPTEMHLSVPVDAAEAGRLLEGAWAPLTQMVERQGFDGAKVQQVLDGYCRTLLVGQQPHEYEHMARVITKALDLPGVRRTA